MASKIKKTYKKRVWQRKAKKDRKSLKLWAEGAREEILRPHIEGYADALARGFRAEHDYVVKVCNEYHARISWRLGDHEEPTLPLPAYDPHARPPVEELTPDDKNEKHLRIEELNLCIRRWLKYRAQSLRHKLSSLDARDNPFAVLLGKLAGVTTPPKARQGYQQYMRESYDTEIAGVVAQRWEDEYVDPTGAANTKKPGAPFRSKIARELFAALPEEKQAEIRGRAVEEGKNARVEYEKAKKEGPLKTPEARAKCIAALGRFMIPILAGVQEYTGLQSVCIFGGPMPKYNGELGTLHVGVGQNLDSTPVHWPAWNKSRFASDVVNFMKEYLNTAYTQQDCAEAALPKAGDVLSDAQYRFADDADLDSDSSSDSDSDEDEDMSDDSDNEDGESTKTKDAGRKRKRSTGEGEREDKGADGTKENKKKRKLASEKEKESDKENEDANKKGKEKAGKAPKATKKTKKLTAEEQEAADEEAALAAEEREAEAEEAAAAAADEAERNTRKLAELGLVNATAEAMGTAEKPARAKPRPRTKDMTARPTGEPRRSGRNAAAATGGGDVIMEDVSAGSQRPTTPPPPTTPQSSTQTVSTEPAALSQARTTPPPPSPPQVSTQMVSTEPASLSTQMEEADAETEIVWPPKAAAWFKNALTELSRHRLGPAYRRLLSEWVELERGYRFCNGTKRLTTVERPTEVETWIRDGRGRTLEIVKIADVAEFAPSWWTWWKRLQPSWRVGEKGELLTPEERGEWGDLVAPGPNGMLSVVATLYWWGYADTGGKQSDPDPTNFQIMARKLGSFPVISDYFQTQKIVRIL
ncbi:hypothetical protein C8R43DRAFT_1142883 [Mycena crocata]|nr:hypothetical protein C8R43DRAFT_1142883 [Mycena crocata]